MPLLNKFEYEYAVTKFKRNLDRLNLHGERTVKEFALYPKIGVNLLITIETEWGPRKREKEEAK